MSTYHTIITNAGKQLFANAAHSTSKVNITHLALGDGNGNVPTPNATRTRLVNERTKVAVNEVKINTSNANWLEVLAIIPSNNGGYTVRELGLYAGSTLVAIGNFPATYKPAANEGGAREMSIKVVIAIENTSVVNVSLDNSLIYATQKWTEDNFVGHNEVIDNLTSTDTNKPLSANMGKVLNDKFTQRLDTLKVGGRNLLKNSGLPNHTISYSTRYELTTPPNVGDEVVITLWGELGADRTGIGVYNTQGYNELFKLTKVADGIYQGRGRWGLPMNGSEPRTPNNTHLNVYFYPGSATSTNRIDRIQLERGNQPSDWTPAPEDTDDRLTTKTDKSTTLSAGNGLTGGGDLSTSRTLSLGTPSKITATTTNAVQANSHTHEIDKASTTTSGIVQLNNTLVSTAINQALTANMGKVLNEKIDNKSDLKTIDWAADKSSNYQHTGFYRSNSQLIDDIASSSMEIHITHPTHEGNAYARGIGFDYGPSFGLYTHAWNVAGKHMGRKRIIIEDATISMTGDGSYLSSFDDKGNATGVMTLSNSGVTAGSYNAVTVDAKGRVTAGLTQTMGLITATTATGTANSATGNANTFLNIVASGVGRASSVGSSTQITGTNGISVSSDTAGKLIVTRDSNSPTATKLQTARRINGVAFDGTQDITIADNTKAPASHRHHWNDIDHKPATYNPAAHTHSISDMTDFNIKELGAENLDNITAWGVYGQMLNVNATSERNYPVINEAGTLEVMIGTYGLRQRFTTFASHRQFERSRNNENTGWRDWAELSNTWDAVRNKPNNLAYTSSNVASATRLATARTISMTGDGVWNVNFDGTQNATGTFTLANSGVTAGSYNSVTVDAKGRVTAGLTQTHGLVTATTATGTANTATTNGNTFLNIVASGVGRASSVGSSTQITGTNGISVSSDTAGKLIISRDNNSPTATKLQTARTINGVAFDGSQDITVFDDTKLGKTENAVSASRLQTARNIALTGAVTGTASFDGTRNLSISTTDDNSIGLVAFFAMNQAPNGWLKANGAAVSRTTYAKLFAKIGTTFGAGDGRTTFNLPDLRGEFIRGFDDGRNVDSGRAFGSQQGDAIRNITGSVRLHEMMEADSADGVFAKTSIQGAKSYRNNSGGNHYTLQFDASTQVPTAQENRPRNIVLLACIKY